MKKVSKKYNVNPKQQIMKKLFYTVIVFIVAVTFSSCKPEPVIKTSYEFYEPVMEWKISMEEVRNRMAAMPNWSEDSESESADELKFSNDKTYAQIEYKFKKDQLKEAMVLYVGCNDKFDQLKSDWADVLDITWTQTSYSGFTFYQAKSEAKECDATAYSGSDSGVDHMYVNFVYSGFIF